MLDVVILASNEAYPYHEQVKVLLKSLHKNNPDQKVIYYGYGYPENTDFTQYNPNLTQYFLNIPEGYTNIGNYLATVRAELLLNIILNDPTIDKIAWFDTDIIVRKSLQGFWDHVEDNSISIISRPNQVIEFKVNSGVFGLKVSDKVKKFLQLYKDKLDNCDKRWYSDQIYLYKSAIELGIKIKHLTYDIISLEFSQQSAIWHSRKMNLNHPVWVKEYRKYLTSLNEE